MRVAIEFYGHLRTFKKAAPSIRKYLIDQYNNPDIFIHTWDKTDHSDVVWHNLEGQRRGNEVTKEDLEFLDATYSPKKILVEPQLTLAENHKYMMRMTENPTSLSMITNVFYTKWRANELRKEYEKSKNVQYDFVIQARLDLYFNKAFDIKKYINYRTIIHKNPLNIDISNKFFFAADKWIKVHKCNDLLFAGGSDVMYFATPSTMDKALSLYNNLDNFDLENEYFSNENLMLRNLIKEGLEPIQVYFEKDIDFGVLRTQNTMDYLTKTSKSMKDLSLYSNLKATIIYFTSPFTRSILKKIYYFLKR